MNLEEFIKKWDGKGIDYDKAYGNQCMDVMLQYVEEVCGLPGAPLGAYSAFDSFSKGNSHFDKFTYSYSGPRPQAGDIIYWDKTVGGYGHVAICLSADSTTLTTFDQNWPVEGYYDNGNFIGTGKAHKQEHDYTGVAGWLRLKQDNSTPMTDQERAAAEDLAARVTKLESDLAIVRHKLEDKVSKKKAAEIAGAQSKKRTKPVRQAVTSIASYLTKKFKSKIKYKSKAGGQKK